MAGHTVNNLIDAYGKAASRLLLLDYDGTLTDLQPTPDMAAPTPKIRKIISRLAADPKNTVVIISGRPKPNIEAWLGYWPVGLSAEHGFFRRQLGGQWQAAAQLNTSWKDVVRQAMQAAVQAVPGSFIEEKTVALSWHYRQSDPEIAKKWVNNLGAMPLPPGLRLEHGSKVVEVRPVSANKGAAAKKWLETGKYDFVLVAGDDVTDEDMFTAMPHSTYTVKIGGGKTAATIGLQNPTEFLKLLAIFCKDQ